MHVYRLVFFIYLFQGKNRYFFGGTFAKCKLIELMAYVTRLLYLGDSMLVNSLH